MRQGERREEAERDRFCGGKVSMSWMERAGYMLDGELSIENLEKQLSSLYAAITSCGASPPHMPPRPLLPVPLWPRLGLPSGAREPEILIITVALIAVPGMANYSFHSI